MRIKTDYCRIYYDGYVEYDPYVEFFGQRRYQRGKHEVQYKPEVLMFHNPVNVRNSSEHFP